MNSKDVYEFFTKFGPVEFAKVHDGKFGNTDFAFVTFESRETRQAALEAGEAELALGNGKKLKVGAARSREIKRKTWVNSPGRASAVQQHQRPLSGLQYDLPRALSNSQYLPANNSEKLEIFNDNNNNSSEQQNTGQQMLLNNNNLEQQIIYLPFYLTNPAYYHPTAGIMFPQYLHQFSQYEPSQDPGNF